MSDRPNKFACGKLAGGRSGGIILPFGFFVCRPPASSFAEAKLASGLLQVGDGEILSSKVSLVGRPLQVLRRQNLLVGSGGIILPFGFWFVGRQPQVLVGRANGYLNDVNVRPP